MLTPSKIKNHHFEASGKNAYRAQSVDDFFDIVADSYEQMFKENGELVKKISLLAERVEEYRNDEDNIRAALLTAQRMADQIMRETNEKAEAQLAEAVANAKKIEAEATAKAQAVVEAAQAKAQATLIEADATSKRLIEDATAEAKEQAVVARDRMIKTQAALGLVEKEADAFKKQLLDLYREHIELISKIPEIEIEEPVEEPVQEAPVQVAAPVEEPAVEEAVVEEAPVIAPPVENEPVMIASVEVDDEPVITEAVVEEPEVVVEAVEAVEEPEEEDLTDEMLERMGLDVPSFVEEEAPVSKYSYIDEDDENYEADEEEEEAAEVDDGYEADDGIKFDLNSIRFGVAEDEDDDEYYDDDEDDDEYYDDDEDDDDDEDGGFGSKLKGFFKR